MGIHLVVFDRSVTKEKVGRSNLAMILVTMASFPSFLLDNARDCPSLSVQAWLCLKVLDSTSTFLALSESARLGSAC